MWLAHTMPAWLLTWMAAEPLEAAMMGAAAICAVVAVVYAAKVARALDAMLRESSELHAEDWLGEGNVRR